MSTADIKSSKELVSHVITNDFMGMQDQKECLTELLIRLQTGSISYDEVYSLISARK